MCGMGLHHSCGIPATPSLSIVSKPRESYGLLSCKAMSLIERTESACSGSAWSGGADGMFSAVYGRSCPCTIMGWQISSLYWVCLVQAPGWQACSVNFVEALRLLALDILLFRLEALLWVSKASSSASAARCDASAALLRAAISSASFSAACAAAAAALALRCAALAAREPVVARDSSVRLLLVQEAVSPKSKP